MVPQRLHLNDEDIFRDNQEAICTKCAGEVNKRVYTIVAVPLLLLILLSICSIIVSFLGIIEAMDKVTFDPQLEPYNLDP